MMYTVYFSMSFCDTSLALAMAACACEITLKGIGRIDSYRTEKSLKSVHTSWEVQFQTNMD